MQANVINRTVKKFVHLLLGKPNSFFFHTHFNFRLAVLGIIYDYLIVFSSFFKIKAVILFLYNFLAGNYPFTDKPLHSS